MKPIEHYQYSVVITFLPNPLKHLNTLRVEVNPSKFNDNLYSTRFKNLHYVLANLDFSASLDTNLAFNQTEFLNVIELTLPLYANEAEIAKDLVDILEQDEFFGKDSVLNRVTIKKELRK